MRHQIGRLNSAVSANAITIRNFDQDGNAVWHQVIVDLEPVFDSIKTRQALLGPRRAKNQLACRSPVS